MSVEKPNTIYPLPQIEYQSLADLQENRPTALITNAHDWGRVGNLLSLPIVVQAEPERVDVDFFNYLSDNVPSVVEVVYAVGSTHQIIIGKIIAHNNKLPLVIIPTELDSDQMFEPHVELLIDGVISNLHTGAAERLIVDWSVIQAADPHRRAGMVADMLSVVTGLMDWRFATQQRRTSPDEAFVPWAAGIAAQLATQTIKIAEAIGQGKIEALRTLLDLTSLSVQLASQLGHARQQEGTEHYLAFALQKQGVKVSHAEALGPGILFTSALHNQDPTALKDALQKAGIRLDQLRPADVQLAVQDLPMFVQANNLPYAIAHELDPLSEKVQKALEVAGLTAPESGWVLGDTANLPPFGLTE